MEETTGSCLALKNQLEGRETMVQSLEQGCFSGSCEVVN